MAEITWGQIAKTVADKTTIDEQIDADVLTHNEDVSAHGQLGEGIAVHRMADILDHIAESVNNSKILKMARAYKFIVDAAGEGDYTDIQEAIDAANADGGGRIFIKAGTYTLSADLTLYSDIQLYGEDDDTTIIDCDSGEHKIKAIGTSGTHKKNIVINGIQVKDRVSDSDGAIHFNYVDDSKITDCYFTNNLPDTSAEIFDVYLEDCERVDVIFNRSVSSHTFMGINGNEGGEVRYNYIKSTASYGILIYVADYCEVSSNLFHLCVDDAIHVDDATQNCIFTNNIGRELGAGGLNLASSLICTIIGNIMDGDDTAGYGLKLHIGGHCQIQGNFFKDFGTQGIYLTNTGHCSIMGNRVSSCGGYGVNIANSACEDNIVVGNQLEGNTTGALNDAGTDTVKGHNAGVTDSVVTYNRGLTSRNTASGTGTQNIAHGLGKIPKKIHIHAVGSPGSGNIANSHGHAIGISNEGCNYQMISSIGGAVSAQNSTGILRLFNGSGAGSSANVIANISAIDATNITLDFTTLANGGSDWYIYIEWEAEA